LELFVVSSRQFTDPSFPRKRESSERLAVFYCLLSFVALDSRLRGNDVEFRPCYRAFGAAPRRETVHIMFRVTQQIDFCYGHRLLNYDGKCKHLHGHNGRVVISLEGERLDERGMLVDFTDIKRSLRTWIDRELDHRMIMHRDDPLLPVLVAHQQPVYVIPENPTAENIAKLIFEQARQFGFPVREVVLWETRNSCAAFGE